MYYYVNILLTKNALNTFISNENNFVQNQLLRSADSISFSFIPVAYSALLCWSPASIDFNGAALNSFFQCLETRRSLDNAAIMSRPRTLSVSGMNGGVGWPGLRASAWWLEGLSSLFNPLLCPKTLVFWGRQLIKGIFFFCSLFAIHIVTYQLLEFCEKNFFINKWQGGGSFSQCKETVGVGVGVGVVFRLWLVSLCVSISNSVPSRICMCSRKTNCCNLHRIFHTISHHIHCFSLT